MRCSSSSASSHCCSAPSHTSVLLYTLAVRRDLRAGAVQLFSVLSRGGTRCQACRAGFSAHLCWCC